MSHLYVDPDAPVRIPGVTYRDEQDGGGGGGLNLQALMGLAGLLPPVETDESAREAQRALGASLRGRQGLATPEGPPTAEVLREGSLPTPPQSGPQYGPEPQPQPTGPQWIGPPDARYRVESGGPGTPEQAVAQLGAYQRSRGPEDVEQVGGRSLFYGGADTRPRPIPAEEDAVMTARAQLKAALDVQGQMPPGQAIQYQAEIDRRFKQLQTAQATMGAIQAPSPRERAETEEARYQGEQALTRRALGGEPGREDRFYTEPTIGKGKTGGLAVVGGKRVLRPEVAEREKVSTQQALAGEKATREAGLPYAQHPDGGRKNRILVDKETGKNIGRGVRYGDVDPETMAELPVQDYRQMHQLEALMTSYKRSADKIIAEAQRPGANVSQAIGVWAGRALGTSTLAADLANLKSHMMRGVKALTGSARFSENITNMEAEAGAIKPQDTVAVGATKANNFLAQLQDIIDLTLERPVGRMRPESQVAPRAGGSVPTGPRPPGAAYYSPSKGYLDAQGNPIGGR